MTEWGEASWSHLQESKVTETEFRQKVKLQSQVKQSSTENAFFCFSEWGRGRGRSVCQQKQHDFLSDNAFHQWPTLAEMGFCVVNTTDELNLKAQTKLKPSLVLVHTAMATAKSKNEAALFVFVVFLNQEENVVSGGWVSS